MSLFCNCDEVRLYVDSEVEHEAKIRRARLRDHEKRLEILERLFKESKPYKKAECEVLKEYAEQG